MWGPKRVERVTLNYCGVSEATLIGTRHSCLLPAGKMPRRVCHRRSCTCCSQAAPQTSLYTVWTVLGMRRVCCIKAFDFLWQQKVSALQMIQLTILKVQDLCHLQPAERWCDADAVLFNPVGSTFCKQFAVYVVRQLSTNVGCFFVSFNKFFFKPSCMQTSSACFFHVVNRGKWYYIHLYTASSNFACYNLDVLSSVPSDICQPLFPFNLVILQRAKYHKMSWNITACGSFQKNNVLPI